MRDLEIIREEALKLIGSVEKLEALDSLRVRYLGKSGVVTSQLKQLGSLPAEERKAFGARANAARDAISTAIDARAETLRRAGIEERLATEWLDVSLPTREEERGSIHPTSRVLEELGAIFARQGFAVAEGPEIEDDYHNFTALNFPENHPARQMHDTFFLQGIRPPGEPGILSTSPLSPRSPDNHLLLRTHTSPVQIRTMQAGKPPFRFIAPGKTFRHDSDVTHTPMFHQVEGFVVDKGIHMGHLKGCVESFLREFFATPDVPIRFRPSFFPFTEPSAEVDIGCARAGGQIRVGAGGDWLEVMGCGMIHPNVLKNCNVDPADWQGFAFGVGADRLAMLKYGIPDLRAFFESDLRWLKHYGFPPLGEIA